MMCKYNKKCECQDVEEGDIIKIIYSFSDTDLTALVKNIKVFHPSYHNIVFSTENFELKNGKKMIETNHAFDYCKIIMKHSKKSEKYWNKIKLIYEVI